MARINLHVALEGNNTLVATLTRKGMRPTVERHSYPTPEAASAAVLRALEAMNPLYGTQDLSHRTITPR